MSSTSRLAELLERWLKQQTSAAENEELTSLIDGPSAERELNPLLREAWEHANVREVLPSGRLRQIAMEITSRYPKKEEYPDRSPSLTGHLRFTRNKWFKYAAAIIIIITGLSLYYIFSNSSPSETRVVQTIPDAMPDDIRPGTDRAILTLSNGQKVELGNAASETITDGTLSIKNSNGQLTYTGNVIPGQAPGVPGQPGGPNQESVSASNTMTTPRGGQYQLTLSDGTKVWLNAASSITYPTLFIGNTRKVSISGEAYFEVSKNKLQPFIVQTAGEEITVLGTAFNVNSYADEPTSKISLVEGSVKVADKVLKPGDAFVNGKVIRTNVEQDAAWKNGIFNFQGLTIPDAMRQIARWYDIEVRFEGDFSDIVIRGKIGRNLTLEDVLNGMEDRNIHFRRNNRILTVYK